MLLIEVLHGTTEIRWGSSLRDNYLMFFVLLCVFLVCFVVVFLATKGAKELQRAQRNIAKLTKDIMEELGFKFNCKL